MILFSILGILTVLIAAYAAGGRKWLKTKPWAAGFFARIEWIEIKGWRKSESLLWNRFLQGLGALLTAITSLGQFDLSPVKEVLPEKLQWIPPVAPLIITMSGVMGENLRRYSTKPLELVEVPDAVAATPHVAAAIEAADKSKEAAVATVKIDAVEKEVSGFT